MAEQKGEAVARSIMSDAFINRGWIPGPEGLDAYIENGENILKSCDPNAVLFAIGGRETYATRYAQTVLKTREDVLILHRNFLNQPKYIDYLKKNTRLSGLLSDFELVDTEIDEVARKLFKILTMNNVPCNEILACYPLAIPPDSFYVLGYVLKHRYFESDFDYALKVLEIFKNSDFSFEKNLQFEKKYEEPEGFITSNYVSAVTYAVYPLGNNGMAEEAQKYLLDATEDAALIRGGFYTGLYLVYRYQYSKAFDLPDIDRWIEAIQENWELVVENNSDETISALRSDFM